MNEIVVGVDGSETAKRAARRAATLASASGVGLHLVTTVRKSAKTVRGSAESWQIDSLSEGEQLLASLRVSLPCGTITTSVQHGDAAEVLCGEAERLDASMIVVGNRRVQGVSRVLGAIATQVARHAPCDVLIANTAIEQVDADGGAGEDAGDAAN